MSHSAGPWHRAKGGDDTLVLSATNKPVARVQKGSLPPDATHANARLIAAAPDLLAACKDALLWIIDEWDEGHCTIIRLKDAIAKAEGK